MMKQTYRILYWFGSITTERYIKASSESDAIAVFKAICGDHDIISIELAYRV